VISFWKSHFKFNRVDYSRVSCGSNWFFFLRGAGAQKKHPASPQNAYKRIHVPIS